MRVASISLYLLSAHGCRFACMMSPEKEPSVSRVDVGQVAAWFGDVKKLADCDLLKNIISYFVP